MENKETYEELVNCIEQEAIKTDEEVVTFNKNELLKAIQLTKDVELKKATLKLWDSELKGAYYEDERKRIKKGDKIEFIGDAYGEQKEFILKHWNEVDKIIEILQYHINELELKKASEEKGEAKE